MTEKSDLSSRPNTIEEIVAIEMLLSEYESRSMLTVYEEASKDEIFLISDIFAKICLPCEDVRTQIIATPDCNSLQLHELILESCYKSYEFSEIPQSISAIRRETWNLLDQTKTEYLGEPLIAIAHAENLTEEAIKEIRDLQFRCETSFILGLSEANMRVPARRSFVVHPQRIFFDSLMQIERDISLFASQGVSLADAFQIVRKSQLNLLEDEDNEDDDDDEIVEEQTQN